jgi:hypothetical protein
MTVMLASRKRGPEKGKFQIRASQKPISVTDARGAACLALGATYLCTELVVNRASLAWQAQRTQMMGHAW